MTEKSIHVPTIIDDDQTDFTVVATNPEAMARSQKSLILWIARKLQVEKQALAEAKENLETAVKSKWKLGPWKRSLERSEERLTFYRKVKAALEAGYYIVPPFPLDLFAIRTKQKPQDRIWGRWGIDQQSTRLKADILAEGEGQYLSVFPALCEHKEYARDPATGRTDYDKATKKWFEAVSTQLVDFPFKMARPAILKEAARAMEMKVFDQLGVLRDRPRTPPIQSRGAGGIAPAFSAVGPRPAVG